MTPDDLEPPDLDADLGALAAQLRSLRPGALDPTRRDAILVAAVRASARRSRMSGRLWPALAASFALVALAEGVLLARRPPPAVVERIVVVREPAAPLPSVASEVPAPPAPDPGTAGPRPRSRFDLDDRALARSTGEVTPQLPRPSGPALRRAIFRSTPSPLGGPT